MVPPSNPELLVEKDSQPSPSTPTTSVQTDSPKAPERHALCNITYYTSSQDNLQHQPTNQLPPTLPSYSCEIPDHAALDKAADYVEEVLRENGFYRNLYESDVPPPSSNQPLHNPASGISDQSTSVEENDELDSNNTRQISRSDAGDAEHDELKSGMDDITKKFERLQQQVKDMTTALETIEEHVPASVEEADKHKSEEAEEGNDTP